MIFHPEEKETDDARIPLPLTSDTNEDTTQMYVMNNYMGFGMDAEVVLGFHNARQKNPDKFNSRYKYMNSAGVVYFWCSDC